MNIANNDAVLLSDRLRTATRHQHAGVDHAIMAARPFDHLDRYGLFLKLQHALHRDVAPLYARYALRAQQDGLALESRLDAVAQDLDDLGLPHPIYDRNAKLSELSEDALPEALGWLYVIEGSNLGAAFLLKYAKKLGLSETYGARHLAEPAGGRSRHWKAVKRLLDLPLRPESDIIRARTAANLAFAHVRDLVDLHLGEGG